MSWEVFALALLAALGWFWLSSLRVREHALAAGRHACTEAGVQFLDDTVALAHIRMARNDLGQLKFARLYRFEFSSTGDNRRRGNIRALGEHVESVEMDGDWYAGKAQVISIDD
jgi:hypothetical protein